MIPAGTSEVYSNSLVWGLFRYRMEDYDFFLRGYARCESFYCFPETGYLYHISGSGSDSGRYSDSLYRQLIGVQTKCSDLLKSEGALTDVNERILTEAIGGLSLASFLEMKKASYSKVKTCMDFLWENPYCIPAVNSKITTKKALKRFILKRNVPMTFLFVLFWRLYLSSLPRRRLSMRLPAGTPSWTGRTPPR